MKVIPSILPTIFIFRITPGAKRAESEKLLCSVSFCFGGVGGTACAEPKRNGKNKTVYKLVKTSVGQLEELGVRWVRKTRRLQRIDGVCDQEPHVYGQYTSCLCRENRCQPWAVLSHLYLPWRFENMYTSRLRESYWPSAPPLLSSSKLLQPL